MSRKALMRARPFAVVLALGVSVCAALFVAGKRWESEQIAADFRTVAADYIDGIGERVRGVELVLGAIDAFYDASQAVTGEELLTFARPLLAVSDGAKALEWAPRVQASERSAFENRIRQEGVAGFAIMERRAGALQPAPQRAEYFPVLRVYPSRQNEPAVGLDLASEPISREALERARDSGRPIATAPLMLAKGTGSQRGYLLLVPHYGRGQTADRLRTRRRSLDGFAVAVIPIGNLVEAALAARPLSGIDVRLRDTASPGDAGLLHVHASGVRDGQVPVAPAWLERSPLRVTRILKLANRELKVVAVPSPAYLAGHASLWPAVVLALGILFTAALATLVAILQRRHSRVQALVRARTSALEKTTAKLAAQEGHYRALITKPGVPMLVIDPATGAILEANPAACAFYGYGAEEMQHLRVTDINQLPPAQVEAAVAEATRHSSTRFCVPHKLANHKVREVEVHSSPIEMGGRPVLFCIVQDITEPRRAQESLAKESRKNRAFLRNASDGIHILDADGNILEVSDSFGEMLGYSRDELIGMNMGQVDAFYTPDEVSSLIRQGLAAKERAIFETHHRRKDGSIIEVEISAQSLEMDGERVMFASSRDITARRVLERELEESRTHLEELVATRTAELAASESKFRALVEQSLAGIYIAEDGFVRYANQAFAETMGFDSPIDIIDRVPLMELIAPEDRARVAENVGRRLAGEGDSRRCEFTARRRDGESIQVEVQSRRIANAGGRALIGIAMDVTERRRAEAAREAALAAAENLSRTKSELMANTSHELRTPLNSIIGMASIGLMAKDLPKAQQAFHHILESGEKLRTQDRDDSGFLQGRLRSAPTGAQRHRSTRGGRARGGVSKDPSASHRRWSGRSICAGAPAVLPGG